MVDDNGNSKSKEDLGDIGSYTSGVADIMPPPLTGVPSKYNPSEFTATNDEIVNLFHLGVGVQDIANSIGVQKRIVTEFLKTDMARDRLQDLSLGRDDTIRDISKQIDAMQPGALAVLDDILTGKEEAHISLKQKTAVEVLGMGGNGKITKVEGKHLVAVLDGGGLAAVSRRAMEMELAVESGNLAVVQESGRPATPLAEVLPSDGK